MRKWTKPTIIIPIAIILISLGLWAGFKVLGRFGAFLGPDKFTFYLCDPNELIADMEDAFDLKFPDGITEIKAAKPLWSEGNDSFVIRFTAEPNVVDEFVSSFPRRIVFNEYVPSDHGRSNFSSAPAWYRKPIRKGKIGGSPSRRASGLFVISIDMTNEKKYIVYMDGHY